MGKAFVRIFFQDFQGLIIDLEDVDSWVWKDGEVPVYSVKSTYNCLRRAHEGGIVFMYKKFWRSKAMTSALVSAWRVLENKIATRGNLVRRGIMVERILCSLCEGGGRVLLPLVF